ncbi:hypothetical protein FRX31_020816 [Thalictrum thalictroides]|uniref:Uncharacterized protein n=1 Tax=Thalictrum thalictroides TaxID=46969 RepID=A0A7J6VY30_THATH|nr:hypothetical protein FRX31_020816 [Thalictrum thalictroides]
MGPVKKDSQLANIPASQFSSDVPGSNVLKLANHIVSLSKDDVIASVLPDKATYANAILPLAELEA